MRGFWLFPGVLEGLGSSGRLVGSISTYPGTSPTTWSRVMTKNPGGNFLPSTVPKVEIELDPPADAKTGGKTINTRMLASSFEKQCMPSALDYCSRNLGPTLEPDSRAKSDTRSPKRP